MNPLAPCFRLFRDARIAVLALCFGTNVAFADVVTDWNATLEATLRNPTPSPGVQTRSAAIMHGAMFDAVNGIARKYAPLRVTTSAPPGAQSEAAAAQAAYATLLNLFPAKKALLDEQLSASLDRLTTAGATSQAITVGRAWGTTVATEILAWRENDGFSAVLTYTGSSAPGQWRHTPLETAAPASLNSTVTAPFALTNLPSFDPGPPYGQADRMAALSTPGYLADFNEVRARGGATSTVRTAAQTDLALFINIADVTDINTLVRRLIPASAGLVENARTFALLNMAAVDAQVVCFQSKYKYGFWRPFQAINYADEDGNPATSPDLTWVPLRPTPSHPEYMGAHSAILSAMLGVGSFIFGENTAISLTTSNTGAPAITPTFSSFAALSDAVSEARINAGFHFRSSCNVGQTTGYAVAAQITRNVLLPIPGSGVINLALRGRTGAAGDTLIAGFVVGAGSRQILIRGVGPALTPFGIAGAVPDPRVVLYDSAGRIVLENDNWSAGGATNTAALTAAGGKVGAFPFAANSLDAAVVGTLTPGSYTVHLSSSTAASGVAMIEVYELP